MIHPITSKSKSQRKERSKDVSKNEGMQAEKGGLPPLEEILTRSRLDSKSSKAIFTPTQTTLPPLTGGKSETPSTKKLTVKFAFHGGQLNPPSSGTLVGKEPVALVVPFTKQAMISPTAKLASISPPPSFPKPTPVASRKRVVYCQTCNQYYEIAENNISAEIACINCHNLVQVILTCPSCQGVLSIDINYFVKSKTMQVPCPTCGKSVRIE